MISLSNQPWTIRKATLDDLPAILQLYDDAVAWLNARGNTEQWGTTPVSSRPHLVIKMAEYIQFGAVAESEELLGFIAVDINTPEPFAQLIGQEAVENSCYVRTLVASRTPAARGVGASLLRWAEQYTREQKKTCLRLDCWADNPRLVSYYESVGFVRCGEHDDNDYREQLFQKRIT